MITVTQPTIRRVLSICDDTAIDEFLKQTLHVVSSPTTSSEEKTNTIHLPSLSFELVSVNDWCMGYEEMREAKESGRPFSLLVFVARIDAWDTVRENLEKVWTLDDRICCIVCFSSDAVSCPTRLSLSRPEQWAMFRVPGFPEELLQLVLCLSGRSIFPAQSQYVSTEVTSSDPRGQIENSLEGFGLSHIVEQQTELALARDELATSKVYVNNVLRSMADSLLVIDANLTIGSVNPSLLELLGYEEEELVGQAPGLIFGEEFAQGSIIENLLLQGSVSGIESSFLTSEGRLIPISVSGSMMQDEQGQFQGLVCVAQDITERKHMEEEKLQLHEQLLDTSRQLGMAEVASDVLHNVGNVLNSINVSIGVVSDLIKNSMVGDVGRISQLFHKHGEDLGNYFTTNPKGKQIPAYLEKLSGQLVEERRVALAELDRLRENAQHAQQCVAVQQDVAKVTGIVEPIALVEFIEEALAANQDLVESLQIGIVREFEEIPLLNVDKHQLLEILVDLLRNACQAMASVSRKLLVVRAKIIPGPPDSVCVEIQDSGVGIDPEDLTKIFGQGNTSKESNRGMSLHNGALMAKNLGGSLRVHSDGLGHGAIFSLELPGNFHFPDL